MTLNCALEIGPSLLLPLVSAASVFRTKNQKYCSPIYFHLQLITSKCILCFIRIYCILSCTLSYLSICDFVSVIVYDIVQFSQLAYLLAAGFIINDVLTCGVWCCYTGADLDECERQSPCDHICINHVGNYNCQCYEGYQLYGLTHCAG